MKKVNIVLIIIIMFLIVFGIVFFIVKNNTLSGSLLDYKEYKNIKPENIQYIEIVKYTEAGDNSEIKKNKEDITSIYNMLKNKKFARKTDKTTTDYTTVYRFILNNNTRISIEFEGNCVVINGQRYIIK